VKSASESFYGPAVALTVQHRGFPKKIQMEEYRLKQTSKILHELHRYKKCSKLCTCYIPVKILV
jgi:hypothetical protein